MGALRRQLQGAALTAHISFVSPPRCAWGLHNNFRPVPYRTQYHSEWAFMKGSRQREWSALQKKNKQVGAAFRTAPCQGLEEPLHAGEAADSISSCDAKAAVLQLK